jgi:hypothetical protein
VTLLSAGVACKFVTSAGGVVSGATGVACFVVPVDLFPALSTVFMVNVYATELINPEIFLVIVPFETVTGCVMPLTSGANVIST